MVAFTDVSRLVEAEQQARDAIELQARQAGKLEIATGVMHDIGNAVTSIGVRSARLNADFGRPELMQIQRLAAFLHLNVDGLATALGVEKSAALTQFVVGLANALTERFAYWEDSACILAQTVAHVQAILNIQRANAGAVALHFFDLCLSELLVDVLALQSGPISKRNIAVSCKVASEVPKLRADRTKLVQVLINVIKNACESFDEPGARAEGRCIAILTTVQAEQIRIEIADNGCGFSADSPAAQMRRGVSTKSGGSGLGLASARSLIALHGGTADIVSLGRGLGATVNLTFPIQSELCFA